MVLATQTVIPAKLVLSKAGSGNPEAVNGREWIPAFAGMTVNGALWRADAAALPGLAPYLVESGQYVGRRRIRGGRLQARRLLYIAVLVAARHNPRVKCRYQRLLAKGKPKKVALIAVARKLVVTLNGMLRANQDWAPLPSQCGQE